MSSKEFSSAVAFPEKRLDLYLIINHTLKTYTMKKAKEIITKYGVAIVKPWSQEMYDHNDVVGDQIKENMFAALSAAYKSDNEYVVRKIAETLEGCRYGMGYGIDEMFEATNTNLDRVQNFWLNTEYPDLVEAGICPAVEPWFIGY